VLKKLIKLLLAALLVFNNASNSIFAQAITVQVNETVNKFINQQLYQWKGEASSPSQISIVAKASLDEFILNNDNQGLQYGFYKKQAWCKFALKNIGKTQEYFVTAEQSRIDSLQFFVVRNDTAIEAFPLTGKFKKIWQRPVKSTDFSYSFTLAENEKVDCYLYSNRSFGGHSAVINIRSQNEYKAYEIFFTNYFAFIIGIASLAVIIGFVLYFFINDKTYLLFSYYCISNIFLILADGGYIHSFFNAPSFQLPLYNAVPIFFYLCLSTHTFFTIMLLNLKQSFNSWFYKVGFYFAWGTLIAGILLILPIPIGLRWQIVYVSYFSIFFMDLYIFIAIVTSLKTKNKSTYLYLIGFLSSLITTSILLLANFGLIDNVNQYTYLSYGIPLIEIFCMILGLGFHFSQTVSDRFNAQLTLNKTQANFTKQLFQNTENERQRIAQDLHDGVGQDLILLKKSIAPNSAATDDKINDILNQIRSISRDLHPVILDKIGLKHAIEQQAERLMENEELMVTTEIEYNKQLSKEAELHLYRIIQEALSNSIKYANAHAAKISIAEVNTNLEVKIIDNGKGFNLKEMLQSKKSFGLHSILERSKMIGAVANITSTNKGTTIEINIPIGAEKV
jgi:signal transduction histidine kinase